MARLAPPEDPAVVDPARLVALVGALADVRAVVVGDPVLDVYVYGTTHRISREAPVLVVREDGREARLGGAANAAANLAALGAHTRFVGLVGDDDGGRELAGLFATRGVDARGLLRRAGLQTVTKTRVLAGGVHTTKQQMLRIDREPDGPPDADALAALEAAALAALEDADALVVSDYGDGSTSALYARLVGHARARGLVAVVDSRHQLERFRGASAVTPNAPEAAEALGRPVDRPDAAIEGAELLLERLALDGVLLTRGRDGMAIADRNGVRARLAAHGARDAVDVTGAGDTVTATFTLALAAGASVLEGAALANAAASIVVQRIGAATVAPRELVEALGAWVPAQLEHVTRRAP